VGVGVASRRNGGRVECARQRGVAPEDRGPCELDALALALHDELEAFRPHGEGVFLPIDVQLALERLLQLGGHAPVDRPSPPKFRGVVRLDGRDTTRLSAKRTMTPPIHQRLRSRARLRTSAITNSSPRTISLYDLRKEPIRRTSSSSSGSPFHRRSSSFARS